MTRRFVLALVLGTLASADPVRAQAASSPAPTLRVRDGTRDVVLTPADLGALPRQQLRLAGEKPSDSATVAGVTLWEVLQRSGVPSAEASGRQRAAIYVRVVGADGQTAFFALAELDPGFTRRTVLLADERDGHALDASEGPWRVIAPDDMRHARWIRGLVRVDVGTLPP